MSSATPKHSNRYIILFMSLVCLICALILSVLASTLKPLQDREEKLYQSKQLLIAAKILSHQGEFLIANQEGEREAAEFEAKEEWLVPAKNTPANLATKNAIFTIQKRRIVPMLTNSEGEVSTFEAEGIDYESYLSENQKYGYAHLDWKLVYFIFPNLPLSQPSDKIEPTGYVIPINGYGLWDAVYGYLAIRADCDTVIGTTWYDQKETPGLGANIATPEWQRQFANKVIFSPSPDGSTHFKTAKLGIMIVKTTVQDELGSSPLASHAVDGIAGATVTRNGVQEAYKESLAPYRNFLLKARERYLKRGQNQSKESPQ